MSRLWKLGNEYNSWYLILTRCFSSHNIILHSVAIELSGSISLSHPGWSAAIVDTSIAPYFLTLLMKTIHLWINYFNLMIVTIIFSSENEQLVYWGLAESLPVCTHNYNNVSSHTCNYRQVHKHTSWYKPSVHTQLYTQ